MKAVIGTPQQITVIRRLQKTNCLFPNKFHLGWITGCVGSCVVLLRGTRKCPSPFLKFPTQCTRIYPLSSSRAGAPKNNPVSPLEWVRGLVMYKTPLFAMVNVSDTAPQAGDSRVRFPMVSFWISFRTHYEPGVDSSFKRNEYWEYILGVVKAAGA